MPAVINYFLENKGMEKVKKEQQTILNAYTLDFSKHAENKDIPRITHIWNSIPSQLAKENRKFLYKLVKPGARARDYEDALLWLESAGLIYRVFCTPNPFLPLKAYEICQYSKSIYPMSDCCVNYPGFHLKLYFWVTVHIRNLKELLLKIMFCRV